MKILHTADWHLGKRLVKVERLNEQIAVLIEIEKIAIERAVDLIVVAGDIFDTAVPSADAEIAFYDAVVSLSRHCPIVVIAGNHDDEDRLCAPDLIARRNGIIFTDGENTNGLTLTHSSGARVCGKSGIITINKGGQTLNLAVLPFPTNAKLMDLAKQKNYSEFVGEKIIELSKNFVKGEINAIVSHLFTVGSVVCDERELGGSKIVPVSVFDVPKCNFTMLGHIHKPLTVSKEKNIYYSGSLCRYSFDDSSEKRVLIYESDGETTEVTPVNISGGKKLVTVTVESEEQAFSELNNYADDYVNLIYTGVEPLSATTTASLRKVASLVNLTVQKHDEEETTESLRGKSDTELFECFYKLKRNGKEPSDECVEIFLKALQGELSWEE